jgi:organic hydroperoxide reductase OsmC/OhrA
MPQEFWREFVENKTTYRTFQFENTIAWKSGRRGLLSASQHPDLEVGSPPAFKGDPDVWCPEDLLIGALNTCLMLTFLSVAHRRGLQVVAYESSAQGTLEHSNDQYRVTRVKVYPVVLLNAEADFALAREAMQETVESCIITNSIRAAVELTPQFREATVTFESKAE